MLPRPLMRHTGAGVWMAFPARSAVDDHLERPFGQRFCVQTLLRSCVRLLRPTTRLSSVVLRVASGHGFLLLVGAAHGCQRYFRTNALTSPVSDPVYVGHLDWQYQRW
jgi:hypothetical protein